MLPKRLGLDDLYQVQGTRYEKVGTGRSFVDMCDQAQGRSRADLTVSSSCKTSSVARRHLNAWIAFRRRVSSALVTSVSLL